MIQVYFDGCCCPKNPGGRGGCGVVIKKDGHIIHSLYSFCGEGEKMSNNVAEYEAAIIALKFLKDRQILDAEIFGDSKLVIEQISGHWKIKRGLYREKAIEALELKNSMNNHTLSFTWIPRELNEEADSLSKIGSSPKFSPIPGIQHTPAITGDNEALK